MAATLGVQVVGDATSLKAALGSATVATEKFAAGYRTAFGSMTDETLALTVAQDKLAAQTAKYGVGSTGAAAATLRYRNQVDGLRKAHLATAQGIGRGLTTYVTAPTALAAYESVKLGSRFQDTMQQIVGLSGVAQGKVNQFTQQVLKLAPALGKSPQELAQALYFITSSGVPASKALDVLTVSAQASAAGLGETATVADAVTSAMNAYGPANLSAKHATDVLVATVREGKGEASDFAGVIGNVAALSAQLGVSFNDVGAALASQTRLGIDAETSATQLQRVFSTLVKVTPQSEKAFESVGLSAAGLRKELKEKGLLATLETVKKAFGTNLPALSHAFGDQRAIRGVLALVGKQADSTAQIFQRMSDTTGSLGTAFGAVSKDQMFRFHQDLAQLQVDAIKFGNAIGPTVVKVADGAVKIAGAFGKLPGPIKTDLGVIIGILAVGGPLILAGVKVVKMVEGIGKAFRLLPITAGPALATTEAELAGVEGSAAAAAGEVSALRIGLLGLGALAAVPIAIEVLTKVIGANLVPDKDVHKVKPGAPGGGAVGGTVFERNGKFYQTMIGGRGVATREISPTEFQRLKGLDAKLTSAVPTGADRHGPAASRYQAPTAPTAGPSGGTSGGGGPSLQGRFNLAQYDLARAGLTKTAADDRAALEREAAITREQIAQAKTLKDKTALTQQLAGVQSQINSIDQAAVDKRKKDAEKRKKLAASFTVPLALQIAAAKAGTTSIESDDVKAAKAIRAFAQAAVKSGKLKGQALIDAYNEISQQNSVIGDQVNRASNAVKVSSEKLTAGLGLSKAARLAVEQRFAQSQAHGGYAPRGSAAFGQVIVNVDAGTKDPDAVARAVVKHIQRHQKSGSRQTRGRHGGNQLAIG